MMTFLSSLVLRLQMWMSGTAESAILRVHDPRLRSSMAKGPTFIEYALLAAIIVVIAILLDIFLKGLFNSLFSKIGNAFNSL